MGNYEIEFLLVLYRILSLNLFLSPETQSFFIPIKISVYFKLTFKHNNFFVPYKTFTIKIKHLNVIKIIFFNPQDQWTWSKIDRYFD